MATDIEQKVMEAKMASIVLASVDTQTKDNALEAMAKALDANRNKILDSKITPMRPIGELTLKKLKG